jgi:CDP-diacylglycerol--glycerol-3-phosphate 3-phosphatidyltransferase
MNLANQLTIGRLGLCALFVFFLTSDWDYGVTVALVIFAVAGLTDWLDGYVARRQNMVTDLGKLLDPLADKILISAAFIGLTEYSMIPAWMVVCIIAREFLITGLRVMAATKGQILAAERVGKHKTFSQMMAVIVSLVVLSFEELALEELDVYALLSEAVVYLNWIALCITVGSGAVYFYRNRGLFAEAEPAAAVVSPPILETAESARPAFKEWNVIVEALGQGAQILILRKGGIAEGRSGFQIQHDRFWLFPTQYHEQLEKTKPAARAYASLPGQEKEAVTIRYLAAITDVVYLEDWAQVERLEEVHLWQSAVVKERFDYGKEPGVHAIVVRVYRLAEPRTLPWTRAFDGCKSWVEIPVDWADQALQPVLSDAEYNTRRGQLLAILQAEAAL